jgi:hypothetical protein
MTYGTHCPFLQWGVGMAQSVSVTHCVPWRQKPLTHNQPMAQSELIWHRSNGRHVPVWQCSSLGQSASVMQFCGGGTMQKPMRQTSFGGQSAVLMQPPGFWHTCVMHWVGIGHCASVAQKRSGTQTLPEQMKPKLQSAVEPQVNGWQKPKSQRSPAGQSPSVEHCACGRQMCVALPQNSPAGQGIIGPHPITGSH